MTIQFKRASDYRSLAKSKHLDSLQDSLKDAFRKIEECAEKGLFQVTLPCYGTHTANKIDYLCYLVAQELLDLGFAAQLSVSDGTIRVFWIDALKPGVLLPNRLF